MPDFAIKYYTEQNYLLEYKFVGALRCFEWWKSIELTSYQFADEYNQQKIFVF